MFVHIFEGLETECAAELAAIRTQFPSEKPRCSATPTVIHWEEANAMLEADGVVEPPGFEDLSTAQVRIGPNHTRMGRPSLSSRRRVRPNRGG